MTGHPRKRGTLCMQDDRSRRSACVGDPRSRKTGGLSFQKRRSRHRETSLVKPYTATITSSHDRVGRSRYRKGTGTLPRRGSVAGCRSDQGRLAFGHVREKSSVVRCFLSLRLLGKGPRRATTERRRRRFFSTSSALGTRVLVHPCHSPRLQEL